MASAHATNPSLQSPVLGPFLDRSSRLLSRGHLVNLRVPLAGLAVIVVVFQEGMVYTVAGALC